MFGLNLRQAGAVSRLLRPLNVRKINLDLAAKKDGGEIAVIWTITGQEKFFRLATAAVRLG